MKFEEFKRRTLALAPHNPEQRVGQFCFNQLYLYDSEIAEIVQGGLFSDPFYKDDNLPTFWLMVERLWKDED